MKKIIGTAVLAVLAAGAVFAAEPKIGMKYRTQANLYSKEDNDTKTETHILDQDGVGSAIDEFKFTASTDYAGVVIDLNIDYSSGASTDQYYGWMSFGGLNLTGGKFDSRYTNRADDGIGEISLVDDQKLGVRKYSDTVDPSKNPVTTEYSKTGDKVTYIGSIGYDADNMGAVDGNKVLTLSADYTFKDLPGDLLIKAVANTGKYANNLSDGNVKNTETDTSYTDSGFGIELAYKAEAFSADVVFKKPASDQMVFGVYVKPLMVEQLNAVIGFTYAADTDSEDTNACATVADAYDSKKGVLTEGYSYALSNGPKLAEYAFDARASYQVSDAVAAIFHMNYSTIKYDEELSDLGTDTLSNLWIAGEVSYVVNDTVTAGLDVVYNNWDFGDNIEGDNGLATFTIQPMLVITAGKGAAISTGFNYTTALDSDDGTFQNSMAIPMVFRVAL